jgi:O-acetyl-ADP-ribose deacetylase (regulator of RNase III)
MFSDNLEIDFLEGNLVNFRADALVINTNVRLNLNYRLGRTILQTAGESIAHELQSIMADRYAGRDIPLGTAISTDPGNLNGQIKRLIFVVWWAGDNEYTENHVFMVHAAALREADAHGLRSIAFPLMGRGHRLPFSTIAGGITRAIKQLHGLRKRFSLESISFVSLQRDDLDALSNLITEQLPF